MRRMHSTYSLGTSCFGLGTGLNGVLRKSSGERKPPFTCIMRTTVNQDMLTTLRINQLAKNKSRGGSSHDPGDSHKYSILSAKNGRENACGHVNEQIWCDVSCGCLCNQGQFRYRAPVRNEHRATES